MPSIDHVKAPAVLFVSSQLDIPRLPSQIEAAFCQPPEGWLPGLIEEAGRADAELLRQLAPEAGRCRFPLGEEVRVRPAVRVDGALLLPLEWSGLSPEAIFPAAELDLEAAPLEAAIGTRIELRARLTVVAARHADPALLAAAQEYAQRLLARIGAHLVSDAAA